MEKIGVVVEDDDFARVLVSQSLKGFGFEVALDTHSPALALNYIKSNPVNFLVVDLHLGSGPNGIDLAHASRSHQPNLAIVMLTSFDDPRLLAPGLPAPPRGTKYVTKKEIIREDSLKDLVTEALANPLSIGRIPSYRDSHLGNLTDNQIDLLRLMSLGLSNSEIAKRKYLTEKSVEVAINRLAKILGVERNQSQNQRVHMAKTYFRALGYGHNENK